jgi:hypothetical protein
MDVACSMDGKTKKFWSENLDQRGHFENTSKDGKTILGRAIAQAVSRWLPTAAARVQNRV